MLGQKNEGHGEVAVYFFNQSGAAIHSFEGCGIISQMLSDTAVQSWKKNMTWSQGVTEDVVSVSFFTSPAAAPLPCSLHLVLIISSVQKLYSKVRY